MVFHIGLVKQLVGLETPVIADIGGGIGLFSPGCAAVGMKVTLVDDFSDSVNQSEPGARALSLHRELGVLVESQDVMKGLLLPSNHFDAITTFDSMEHWHHSPKKMFHELVDSLRTGGWFLLGVPNCVNLRKRITVPLGIGKWSPMSVWYEAEVFRGHVREPDVDDLRYIATDMGLKEIRVFGRNWLGYARPGMRGIMPAIDVMLRQWPSLCSDIYVAGRKE
jgi:SAM-dependent methyltransferase